MDRFDVVCLFSIFFLIFLMLACYGSMRLDIPDEEEVTIDANCFYHSWDHIIYGSILGFLWH